MKNSYSTMIKFHLPPVIASSIFFALFHVQMTSQNYQTNHFDNQWSFNRVTQSECLNNPYHTILLGREEHDVNDPKCEAFELDNLGQLVNAREYVSSSGSVVEFLHIEPAFNGYIACGFTNNGVTTVPVVAVLSPSLDVFESRVYPGVYFDGQNNSYTAHGVAMHITTDGQQGFVVSGIVGDGDLLQTGATGKRHALAMRLKPDLSVDWVRAFNGGIPWASEDMDAFNHGTEILDGTKFFFSGSFNGSDSPQEAAAVMLDGAGNLSWGFRYSNQAGGAHSSLSGDVVLNTSAGQIHQLVNNSITHTWGVTTWDLLGNLDLAQTWNSQYADLNWQGLSLLIDPADPNLLTVGGFQRSHGWSGSYGSVPFLTEFKMNTGTATQSTRYLIPQNNGLISASVDALSLFNGQQAQFRQPTMAVRAPEGIFLHGYRGVGATGFSTNGVETAVARDPLAETLCDWEDIPTSFDAGVWEVEDGISTISVTLDDGNFAMTAIASDFVTEACASVPTVCEEVFSPSFTWSYGPGLTCPSGCEIIFDDFISPLYDPTIHCLEWDFGDGTTMSMSGPLSEPLTYCYTSLAGTPPGSPAVCLTVSCCDDATVQSTYCDTLLINCGTPEPCPPLEGDYSIEAFVTSGFGDCLEGCEVGFDCPVLDPDVYCYSWDFGDGTTMSGTAGTCPIHCYEESGTYVACLTITCCDDEDEAPLLVLCTEVTVDCGSCKLPDLASISLDLTIFDDGVFDCEGCAIGVCGLYDADLNEGLLDPFDLCADFFFSDGTSLLGVPFAACYDHCFETAGVHEICMEVYCCDNPDERIVLCESLSCGCPVECSVGNAFWAVGQTANDGECQVQFEGIEFLGPGMAGHQNPTWSVDGILSATSYNATFDLEPGTYNICRTIEGVTPDGTTCLSEHCHDVIVDCCEEACPGDLDGNGVINVSDLLGLLAMFGTSCM